MATATAEAAADPSPLLSEQYSDNVAHLTSLKREERTKRLLHLVKWAPDVKIDNVHSLAAAAAVEDEKKEGEGDPGGVIAASLASRDLREILLGLLPPPAAVGAIVGRNVRVFVRLTL